MQNPTFDWSKFTVKTLIRAELKEVAKLLQNQSGFEKWFLRLAEFTAADGRIRKPDETIAPLDTYKWRWFGFPDTVEEHGKILESNNVDFLKFTFGKAGIVSIKLSRHHEFTFIELTQDNIPHPDTTQVNFHVECKTGWTFYLLNMNSVIQGGLDLRNRDNSLYLD